MHSSSLYISAEHINDFLTKLSQLTYFILFLYLRFQKRQPYIYIIMSDTVLTVLNYQF